MYFRDTSSHCRWKIDIIYQKIIFLVYGPYSCLLARPLFLSLNINKNPLMIKSMISPLGTPMHHWVFLPPSWGCQQKRRWRKRCIYQIKHIRIIIRRLWLKRISENGEKTLMQESDHYFTTQRSIFLLLNNFTDSFSSALGNPLFRMSLWLHTSEKTVRMFNWRNYIIGETSLLHYTTVSIFIFATTNHVNHWTSLDPAHHVIKQNSKWKT